MQLFGPKPKKFWTPAILTQGGGKFIASLTPTFANIFASTNASGGAGTTVDVSLSLPTIPSGALLVATCHTDSGSITGITFDPAGQNIALTVESGASGSGKPFLGDAVLPSGVASGTYVFRCTQGNWQFRWITVAVWYLVGQTVNSPENLQAATGAAVTSFSVTSGRVLLSSASWGGAGTRTWGTSTVAPTASHADGGTLSTAAEWNSNLTTTASWTVASTAGNPTAGTIAATYR